jgi:hypothetical protein
MYFIYGCPNSKCRKYFISEKFNKTDKCPKCEKTHKIDTLRIHYQNEDKDLVEYMLEKLNTYHIQLFTGTKPKVTRHKSYVCIG